MFGMRDNKQDDSNESKTEPKQKIRTRLKKNEKSPTDAKKKELEEKKPWGKKERYLLLFILGITVFGSGILALIARSWKLPGLPRMTVPANVFEDTFVLDQSETRADPHILSKKEDIISHFNQATKNLSGVYGFAVIDLNTSTSFGVHQYEQFQAASLIKLPLMAMLFELSEDKKINLSTRHSVKEDQIRSGAGVLSSEPVGTAVTNRELIEYMGQYSDNTAFRVALDAVGEDRFQSYITDIGMRDTSFETNMTTISDIESYFKKLWDGRIITEEHRDELLGYLTNTSYEDHLAAGIPDTIKVAHKYGRELHVVNDAGIVFSDNPYVVVIMSKGIVESEADEIFPELSRIIFEGMVN